MSNKEQQLQDTVISLKLVWKFTCHTPPLLRVYLQAYSELQHKKERGEGQMIASVVDGVVTKSVGEKKEGRREP
jgi:hypothetical protein